MLSSDIPLSARIAKPSDYRLVARLCRRATGAGDYVLQILREVITDRGLFLACSNGELVGMANFEKCIDGSGWLSMGRTDPNWRRRGVALFLQQQVAAHARQKGIRYLRLWVLSKNRPSLLACMKAGFRPTCEAAHVSSSVRVKLKREQLRPVRSTYQKSLKSLLRSRYLLKTNGYFAYKWHFVKASEELLERLLEKGELYADAETCFVLTKPQMSFGNGFSAFTLLHGSPASNLQRVKAVAKGYGRLFLGCYLPYDPYLLSVARKIGFKRDPWANHCIVLEKRI
jgi:GNAT superfamily N-acetyltransferase